MIDFLKKNALLKVFSLNSVSVLVNFVLGIFSLKIISYYLGSPGMALVGSYRNFTTLFKSVATNGFSQALLKLFVENKEDKKEVQIVISTFFWLFLLLSVFLGILLFVFSESISFFIFRDEHYGFYIKLFGLVLPFFALQTYLTSIFNGLLWYKKIVFAQILSALIVFLITVLLIYYKQLQGAFIAIAVADVVLFGAILAIAIRHQKAMQFDLQKVISKKYWSAIGKFSSMALFSGVIVPLNFILIRNLIIDFHSIEEAGIWDAVNRISGFYMMFFTTGFSFYYLPKLASIQTQSEFKFELVNFYKTVIPLFVILIVGLYWVKDLIVKWILTSEFQEVNSLLLGQLGGDFFKVLTLAFGYQIVVKTLIKRYFIIEIFYNLTYYLLAHLWVVELSANGAVQAYFVANLLNFLLILLLFRKTLVGSKDF